MRRGRWEDTHQGRKHRKPRPDQLAQVTKVVRHQRFNFKEFELTEHRLAEWLAPTWSQSPCDKRNILRVAMYFLVFSGDRLRSSPSERFERVCMGWVNRRAPLQGGWGLDSLNFVRRVFQPSCILHIGQADLDASLDGDGATLVLPSSVVYVTSGTFSAWILTKRQEHNYQVTGNIKA